MPHPAIAASLVLLCLLPLTAAAQAIEPGDEIRVRIRGGAAESYETIRLEGTLHAIEAGRLTAQFDGGPRSMRLDSIIRMDVARERTRSRGAMRGALIGAVAAGTIGFFLGLSNSEPDSGPLITPEIDTGLMAGAILAVPGALLGGVIGAVSPGRRWERVLPTD